MKLTPWYPPHIKPVRVGDYNASYFYDETIMRHWNGSQWSIGWALSYDRLANHGVAAPQQDAISWRGLTATPRNGLPPDWHDVFERKES